MSKYDEPFRPEHVDEQIELLSRSPIEETLPSSDAHLISHLRQAYEDTEIAEQVWARLAQQIANGRDEGVEQPDIDNQIPTIRQKNLKEGPRLMRVVSTEKRSKSSHIRLLETLVAVLILAIVLGIVVTFKIREPSTNLAKPAVSDQTGLYITTHGGVDRINLQTGKAIWHITIEDSPSQIVMEGRVFFTSADLQHPYLQAVDAVTGKLLWHKNDERATILAGTNGILYTGICQTTCYIYALKASTGGQLWSYSTTASYQEITVQNSVLYGISDTHIFALNAARGTTIWQKTLKYPNQTLTATPLVSNNVMYFSFRDATNSSGYFYALNANNGVELWHKPMNGLVLFPSLLADGVIYCGAGNDASSIYAVSAKTGDTLWKYRSDNFLNAPYAAAQGVVFIQKGLIGDSYSLLALRVTDRSVLWSKDLGSAFGNTLVANNGLIYAVVGSTKVEAFHIRDGSLAASYRDDSATILGFTLVTQNT